MRITAIHSRITGSTRQISTLLIDEVKKLQPDVEVTEYVITDFKSCIGCFSCFANGEETCPHYEEVHPIATSIEQADIIIVTSPTYCMGISGAMKSFFDHLGYRWFSHRPHPSMSTKIGIAISTTGSLGARKTTKDIKGHFFGLSIAKYIRLSYAVMATGWDQIKEKKKNRIYSDLKRTAKIINKKSSKATRSLYLKFILFMMKNVHKNNDWFPLDKEWWQKQGWID